MRRLALLSIAPLTLAVPALAQPADPHAGHHMPAPAPQQPSAQAQDPHAAHAPTPQPAPPTAPAADPHAGHAPQAAPAPTPTPDPHAGHAHPGQPPKTPPADPHAHHHAAPQAEAGVQAPPPPIPTDRDADRFFPPAAMNAARAQLMAEHGRISWSMVMADKLELRPHPGSDAYAWEGRASFGGDIRRFVVKSRGEGRHELEEAEVDALYSHAITPYFNLEAGLRQDFEPATRTYASVGIDGVAPYWFELEAALFLSDRGDLTARAEAAYDLRLTQKLILEPRAELNLAAQDVPAQRVGSGVSSVELGLRLRYAIRPEFAPYVGVNYERRVGDAARYARATGEDVGDTRAVFGIRSWF